MLLEPGAAAAAAAAGAAGRILLPATEAAPCTRPCSLDTHSASWGGQPELAVRGLLRSLHSCAVLSVAVRQCAAAGAAGRTPDLHAGMLLLCGQAVCALR